MVDQLFVLTVAPSALRGPSWSSREGRLPSGAARGQAARRVVRAIQLPDGVDGSSASVLWEVPGSVAKLPRSPLFAWKCPAKRLLDLSILEIPQRSPSRGGCVRPMNPYKMARLLRPTLGMLVSSKASADWRSSSLRKPAFAKARAAPSGRPLRSQAFDASQYSSNDEGLRLMSDNLPPICVGS